MEKGYRSTIRDFTVRGVRIMRVLGQRHLDLSKGASIYDVHQIFGFVYPLTRTEFTQPLSAPPPSPTLEVIYGSPLKPATVSSKLGRCFVTYSTWRT